jgi:phospholipase/carboxylesterase
MPTRAVHEPFGSSSSLREVLTHTGGDVDAGAEDSLLLLLHGRGGVATDLAWLADVVRRRWSTVCLQGSIPRGAGFEWFDVPADASIGPSSEHVARAADDLVAWLDEHAYGARVGLVGFSQGGALAVQALRRHPHRFELAVSFAGFMSVDAERGDEELARRRPPFMWSRGVLDDVILDTDISRMSSFLPHHTALEQHLHPNAGHEITAQMAAELAAFLA